MTQFADKTPQQAHKHDGQQDRGETTRRTGCLFRDHQSGWPRPCFWDDTHAPKMSQHKGAGGRKVFFGIKTARAGRLIYYQILTPGPGRDMIERTKHNL